MKQIAIYGKGGIGKSTITANLSAALSHKGHKILQIGCDPKHDSTKLLLGGISQNTVLELLKTKSSHELKKAEIVIKGYNGIDCIEAGGPEPGVGCAGRGILAMAKTFEDIGLQINEYEVVIYDVLGDVVCGGFAVPMRKEYADEIYIVTSGEIMSLYAANNIVKGLLRFDAKLSGIILNKRNVPYEEELVTSFAKRINSEVLVDFPRDNMFREAEIHQSPVIKLFPQSEITEKFYKLAEKVTSANDINTIKPLCDDEFEDLICTITGIKELNRHIRPESIETKIKPEEPPDFKQYLETKKTNVYLSKSVQEREKLHCCSLAGAYAVTGNIENAITIIHAPANCANIALSTGYLSSLAAMVRGIEPSKGHAFPSLLCTNLNESDLIYGGEEKLEKEINNAIQQYSPEAVFIITSCPTGIIGDDPEMAAKKYLNSPVPIIAVPTDGILKGDYSQGVINAYKSITETVIKNNRHTEKQNKLINLVGEELIGNRAEESFTELKSLLNEMGITINCRYARNTKFETIKNFQKAKLSCTMSTNYLAKTAEKMLKDIAGIEFLDAPVPVGYRASMEFIKKLSEATDSQMPVQAIQKLTDEKNRILEEIKPVLKGKKALLNIYSMNIDWLIDIADEIDMEIIGAAVYSSCINKKFESKKVKKFEIENLNDLLALIDKYNPDLLLANYLPRDLSEKVKIGTIPLALPPGFNSVLRIAKSWTKPFLTRPGLWRNDENPEVVL